MKRYELRNSPKIQMPKYAVVEITPIQFGPVSEDIAWFFHLKDATDYIQWRNEKSKNGSVT